MTNNTKDIPYVLVQHNTTGKAFSLSRGYRLMNNDVPLPVKLWMITNNVQADEGWLPTMDHQLPLWTKGMKEGEFTAYWIDYDKHYQQLVVGNDG